MEKTEEQKIREIRDRYQEKADKYYHDYQLDGATSQLRTYERNQRMADALTNALNGSKTQEKYIDLRYRVAELDVKDTESLARRVEYIQGLINEGIL